MTPNFFHHILAIDLFQISQDNFFFGKRTISPICGFFRHFFALFDTLTSRYNDFDIKFNFFCYFYPYKHFIQKSFLKMNQKCPSDLVAMLGSENNGDTKHICRIQGTSLSGLI